MILPEDMKGRLVTDPNTVGNRDCGKAKFSERMKWPEFFASPPDDKHNL